MHHAAPCSPAFHALFVFATIFGFSPFYPCCNHLSLDFMVFHLVCKAIYKPFLYTLRDDFFAVNKIRAPFSRFFCFSLIFSPFLGCQTPSKDDNLEDERLKPLPP